MTIATPVSFVKDWRVEARRQSDGCTELTCLYHGRKNWQTFLRYAAASRPKVR